LSDKGYRKYSETQFYKKENEKYYRETYLSFEDCLLIELMTNGEFIYAPTYAEVYDWLIENYSDWNVSVMWDNEIGGYYFVVQNTNTGYEYRQPTVPREENIARIWEWGFEHVIKRL